MSIKKYLSLDGLTDYDVKIKEKISSDDDAILSSAKSYTDENTQEMTDEQIDQICGELEDVEPGAGTGGGTITGIIPVSSGGTGATTVEDARINLDVYSTVEIDTALFEKANLNHNHDTIYDAKGAAETALNSANTYTDFVMSSKADASHTHNDIYYTETEIDEKLANITNFNHNHDSAYDVKGAANAALESAKTYADEVSANAAATVKNDILNGAGAAYDTLKELGDLIDTNTNAIEALNIVADSKAHTHNISDITNLQTELDDKVSQIDLDSHTSDAIPHITSIERTNWNSAKAHADSDHAPSDAEKNQNAFSYVKINETTVSADTVTDTLTLSGLNVTIAPDTESNNITIEITNENVASALGYTPQESGDYADASHTHNDIYYTETEIDAKLNDKSDTGHVHSAEEITGGTLDSNRLPVVPIEKGGTGANTAENALFNLGFTATSAEINTLDGIAVTTEELNYISGVESNIQGQLDGKAPSAHNHAAENITSGTLDSNRLPVVPISKGGTGATTASDALSNLGITATATELNKLDGVTVTTTELNYVDGVTSNIQTQLDGKAASSHNHAATNITSGTLSSDRLPTIPISKGGTGSTTAAGALTNLGITATASELNKLDGVTATTTELNYVDGVTSNIQTQLNGKASSSHTHSDYMTKSSPTGTGSFSMHRKSGTTVGLRSHAEGDNCEASGSYSHAEGYNTVASDHYSHAEGAYTNAFGQSSHAEGTYAVAYGNYSHAEGYNTYAYGTHSHVEGQSTYDYVSAASSSTDNDTIISKWGDYKFSLAKGEASHVEGKDNLSLGDYSHSEGYSNKASALCSHAEGNATTASGEGSHAKGVSTTASGTASYAEGYATTSSGTASHAEGILTHAAGDYSHAEGCGTGANIFQHVSGKYNTIKTGPATQDTQDTSNADAIFIVGCGTTSTTKNGFRVTSSGKCYGSTSFGASGADFAELFEWKDGNPNDEDRRGLFVTLDRDKIKLANANDDYIGIISGAHAFIGNSASEEWQGKYLTDVFGTPLSQEIEVSAEIDKETGKVIKEAYTTTQYVVNPDYDPDAEYIMRENRKEWGVVGLLGQIVVIDDGTCVIDGYVKPSTNGIGTASDTGYRVMKRIDDNHVKVLVR